MNNRIIKTNVSNIFIYKTVYNYIIRSYLRRVKLLKNFNIILNVCIITRNKKSFQVIKDLVCVNGNKIDNINSISSTLISFFNENKDLIKRYRVKRIKIYYSIVTYSPLKAKFKKNKFIIIILCILLFLIAYCTSLFLYNKMFIVKDLSMVNSFLPFVNEVQNYRNHENKLSIFKPFIDLFNQNGQIYRYFPSYFVNNGNFWLNIDSPEISITPVFSTMKIVNYNTYFTLEYRNDSYYCLINDLYDIVSEYIKANANK